MIQGKILTYGDDLTEVYAIRKSVFQEEQGVAQEIDFDGLDQEAIHVIVYESTNHSIPVATGRMVYDNGRCKIGRVAVLKPFRRQGYGEFVVRLLLNKAFITNIEEVYLNAQVSSIGLYEKVGFMRTGSEFEEAGIKHIKMTIKRENILSNCKKSKYF